MPITVLQNFEIQLLAHVWAYLAVGSNVDGNHYGTVSDVI